MDGPLARRCLCEAIGTFWLILIGCGAMVVDFQSEALTHPGVAIAWGLIVMTMVYAIGDVSGAHINPAVTLAFAAVGRFPWGEVVGYVASQIAGATLAALALAVLFGHDDHRLGSTVFETSVAVAWWIEFLMTALLMFIIMGVSTGAKEKSITAGLAVGATIAMEAMVAGPLTKASMNPARSFGPAVVSGAMDELWVYWSAPLAGALAGAWLYRMIRPEQPSGAPSIQAE
ncbi:MAG: aquaporin [Planctomycetota bacterium]